MVVSQDFTLADLFHLPLGYYITEKAGFKGLTATPNVARWWADITSRPAWKQVHDEVEAFFAQMMKK